MKKEQFIREKTQIEDKIKSLKIQIEQLKQEYINSNAKFEIGQKVKIITPPHKFYTLGNKEGMTQHKERFAYIYGHRVDYKNDVCFMLKKAKIDGTISKHDDYFNEIKSTIEKA